MNVFLWMLQILLALHTLIGALWKISNPEQTVPALAQIPHGAWLALSAFEVLFSVGLVMPAIFRPMRILAPIAATCIAAEMLTFALVASKSAQPITVRWCIGWWWQSYAPSLQPPGLRNRPRRKNRVITLQD